MSLLLVRHVVSGKWPVPSRAGGTGVAVAVAVEVEVGVEVEVAVSVGVGVVGVLVGVAVTGPVPGLETCTRTARQTRFISV
jgi:hypothetical protein